MKTKLITLAALVGLCFAGDYHQVVIDDNRPCCECHCEYNPEEDVTFYGEDIRYCYKYFGGVPHVCVGLPHDCSEKGIDLTKEHKPHLCHGEWCDSRCCFTLDDYFYTKNAQEQEIYGDIIGGHRPYPVIPTPPPVSSQN